MPRPWLLAEMTYADLRDHLPEVVVLPFGATEPHNLHLPYATDTIEADLLAWRACEKAHDRGASVVCLPTIPYGTETNQIGFPLSMNLMPSTVLTILRDLVQSIEQSGIRKCLVLNSHGGNAFKGMLRELFPQTQVKLFVCNWYTIRDGYDDVFETREDHAGEMETSLILHARPDLVRMSEADDGSIRAFRLEALRKGWVEITREWKVLTTNSGSGNPRSATAEKGRRWTEMIASRVADFLCELSSSPIDEDFPFDPRKQLPDEN